MRRLKGILIIIIVYLVIEFLYVPGAPDHIRNKVVLRMNSYNMVANMLYEDYLEYGEERMTYPIGQYGKLYRLTGEGTDLENTLLELTQEENNSLQNIISIFRLNDRGLDAIRVYDGYVSFWNDNGTASIIYSVDGSPPRFIEMPYTYGSKYRCYRINDNWYYMNDESYYIDVLIFFIYVSIFEWPYKVLLVVAFIVMCMLLKRKYDKSAPEHIRNIIKQYNTSYVAIAKSIYKDFRKNKGKRGEYFIEDGKIQCLTEPKHELVLSEHEYFSCKKVVSSYKELHKNWEAVYVYKYNVLFINEQDGETLIYSVDNLRPFRIKTPNARFTYCKKIKKHWYYTSKS